MRISSSVRLLLLVTMFVPGQAFAQSWIEGEMGYRVTVIPDGSPAARSGLHVADILAEPAVPPDRLLEASAAGVDIPIYRFDRSTAAYTKQMLKVVFKDGEEKRLGTTGDLGFFVTGTKPRSLGERAELKPGDFIPKINDTFVHSVGDLTLVDAAYGKDEQVFIQFTRWYPDSSEFKTLISRRRFVR